MGFTSRTAFRVLLSTGHAKAHVTIHFQSTSVIHCLLLFLQLAHFFTNGIALWYWTIRVLALLRVDAQQGPYTLANFTTTLHLDATGTRMFQVTLHLRTVAGRTCLGVTSRCVFDKLNMH